MQERTLAGRYRLPRLPAFVFGAFVALLAPAAAQIPDEFTNLKVLPQDIERRALIDEMRGFASALGVRCNHCHVGESEVSLEGFDFPSDDKETKTVARAMIRMVREINDKLLPGTGREPAKLLKVSCITCHHRLRRPQTLEQILLPIIQDGGAGAAIERYRELRREYHGRGVFNLSEFALTSLAETVAKQESGREDATALLETNLEFFPESAHTYYMLGQVSEISGDEEEAIASYRKAIELEPGNSWYKTRLEALTKD